MGTENVEQDESLVIEQESSQIRKKKKHKNKEKDISEPLEELEGINHEKRSAKKKKHKLEELESTNEENNSLKKNKHKHIKDKSVTLEELEPSTDDNVLMKKKKHKHQHKDIDDQENQREKIEEQLDISMNFSAGSENSSGQPLVHQ